MEDVCSMISTSLTQARQVWSYSFATQQTQDFALLSALNMGTHLLVRCKLFLLDMADKPNTRANGVLAQYGILKFIAPCLSTKELFSLGGTCRAIHAGLFDTVVETVDASTATGEPAVEGDGDPDDDTKTKSPNDFKSTRLERKTILPLLTKCDGVGMRIRDMIHQPGRQATHYFLHSTSKCEAGNPSVETRACKNCAAITCDEYRIRMVYQDTFSPIGTGRRMYLWATL